MLKKIDALPDTELQPPGSHGNGFACPCQSHPQMAGGIIRTLSYMNQTRMIFGDQFLKKAMQVRPCRGSAFS